MKVKFSGELRSVSLREFNKRDGSKGYSYPLLVETEGESYSFNANVETYNNFVKGFLEKGMMCDFVAEYNPRFQYNNFNILEVVPH